MGIWEFGGLHIWEYLYFERVICMGVYIFWGVLYVGVYVCLRALAKTGCDTGAAEHQLSRSPGKSPKPIPAHPPGSLWADWDSFQHLLPLHGKLCQPNCTSEKCCKMGTWGVHWGLLVLDVSPGPKTRGFCSLGRAWSSPGAPRPPGCHPRDAAHPCLG